MSNHGWPEESDSDVIQSLIRARDTLERECHREHDKNVELTDRIRTLEWRVKELELELDYESEIEHGTYQSGIDAGKALRAHRATKPAK